MARTIFHDDRQWTNWHLTVKDVPIAGRFEQLNASGTPTLARMAESAAAIQKVIGRAFADRRRLRAQGAAWSFSEAASIPGGWSFATGYLNWLFPLPATHVHPSFGGDRDGFVLCQTGVSVSELNQYLEANGRSLRTTGASNGQTFVGAMSASTHGSAIDQTAIQGQVAAIQLLCGPSAEHNLWIERDTRPVTDGRAAAQLGATVVRDDRLFEAALVGLGAFGIIHAVLIETMPIFLMHMNRKRIPVSPGLKDAMAGGSFASAGLPGASGRPYFFQSVVNDHIDAGHAYVTVGHKIAWDPNHKLVYDLQNKRGPGYDLAVVVANLLEAFPGLTPPITKAVMADQLKPITDRKASWGQSFNYTTPRAGTAGSAAAVPAERVHDVLAIYGKALKKVGKAPVAFACRYAVKSPGLLAFQRYPKTAIIDIDGIDTPLTRQMMAQALADLRAAGIPNAEHWGKINQMTAASVRDSYGSDLETWIKARTDLLSREAEYVFGSAFLDRLGLTNPAW